jgi:uncharacterized protein (TIGR03067 family)
MQLLLPVLALVLAADVKSDDAAKAEAKKLEGAWTLVSVQAGGMDVPLKQLGLEQVVVQGGKMTLRAQGADVATYTFTVDPSRKPKVLDWIQEKDNTTLPLIYALEGDDLQLCMPLVPKNRKPGEKLERPTGFDSKDKPWMHLKAKREKK